MAGMPTTPDRRTATTDVTEAPRYVVWELTLKCDLACKHCGSRAGRPREEELTLEQCFDIAEQLAAMGTKEVAFIGGEAYLAPRWLEVVEKVTELGIYASMTTGGRGFSATMAKAAHRAGLKQISVSIDGLAATHDTLRNLRGSHAAAMAAIDNAQAVGIAATANTQFNRLNLPEVEELAASLFDKRIRAWQVQITGPMGRAADLPERLLQPYEMLELVPRLAAVAREAKKRGIAVMAANNLGYYGPYAKDLRNGHVFQGCVAGRHVLGIESNGDLKGCPSLPSAPYVGGNLKHTPLSTIWDQSAELRFARDRGTDELWGHCKSCYYAEVCRGGCSWTAHTLLGRRGNMPYCYHRADTLKQRGLRERVQRVETGPGTPFDFGRFELIEEPWDADGRPTG